MVVVTRHDEKYRCIWRVKGQVQGVGFRPFVYRIAHELDLAGTVRNDPSGVTIDAIASEARLKSFERRLRAEMPPLARIDDVTCQCYEPTEDAGEPFHIVASDREPAARGRVTVDSVVCADCLREMFDPGDRRHGHPLINCTNCGPRYTIVRDLPYDRPLTTMAPFPMCPRCAAEYGDPSDRRFHAQPTCCPDCGPTLALIDPAGRQWSRPMMTAAHLLRHDGVIAMKGLGGYHLVCAATSEHAVSRLRRFKKRDFKPFAIMLPNVEAADRVVMLSPEAKALLRSPACPIVLAARREGECSIAPSVAPGSHRLGVMIPYTPMQHLLFEQRLGPLVMTSANMSDDPLIKDDETAFEQLRGMYDAVLLHDRAIERAVDDSIVIDAPSGVLPVRRARGYVPTPISIPVHAPRPGLCVGGELKSTVAVVRGGEAVVSQHLGDLTYALAYERFEKTIDDLLRLFDIEPKWIACDAHPLYLSHQYATRRAQTGLQVIEVQHHHAHLASLLAEYGRSDRIVGLICDGVGYGTDGTAWGGEVLVGDLVGFHRAGRMRPLRLPGGDAAAKETGRCAMAWLFDWLGPAALEHPLAERALADEDRRRAVGRMLEGDVNCPPSSGLGRLFDATAALLGVCDRNHYEAMSGHRLEAAASRATRRKDGGGVLPALPRLVDDEALLEIDHRPLLAQMWTMINDGETLETLAWLFHDALADALARAAAATARRSGLGTVGLSGGVFCNTLLTSLVYDRLSRDGLEVLMHRSVPPNDGGLAYGQAAIAAALLSKGESEVCDVSGIAGEDH